MKQYLFLIFVLLSFNVSAQEWFSEGAQWKNQIYGGFGQFEGEGLVQVNRDTIINGTSAKILSNYASLDNEMELLSEHIVHERNDSIFYYQDEQFYLAYDFNMEVGDSIEWLPRQVNFNIEISACKFFFFLDSVMTRQINGINIDFQYGRLNSTHFGTSIPIVIAEYIGWVAADYSLDGDYQNFGFVIPDYNVTCFFDAPGLGEFCSFTSEFLDFQFVEENCDELPLRLDIIDKVDLGISPNPTIGFLNIEGINKGTIKIFSIDGRLMHSQKLNGSLVDVSRLENGTYILRLISGPKIEAAFFIKQ